MKTFIVSLTLLIIWIIATIIFFHTSQQKEFINDFPVYSAYYDLIKKYETPKLLNNPTYKNLKLIIKHQNNINELNENLEKYQSWDVKEVKEFEPIENIINLK